MINNSKNIFVSFKNTSIHNRHEETKDTELASSLTDLLQSEGYTVFYFKHHQSPGEVIDDKLDKAITQSSYFIWVSTSSAHQSPTVLNEISLFEELRAKNPKLLFIPFLDKKFTVDQYLSKDSKLESIKNLQVVTFDVTSNNNKDFLNKAKIVVDTINKHNKKFYPTPKKILDLSKAKSKSVTEEEISIELHDKVNDFLTEQQILNDYIEKYKDNSRKLSFRQYEKLPKMISNLINNLKTLTEEIPFIETKFPTLMTLKELASWRNTFNNELKKIKREQNISFSGRAFFSVKRAYKNAIKKIKSSKYTISESDSNEERLSWVINEHKDPNLKKQKKNDIIQHNDEQLIKYRLVSNGLIIKVVSIEVKNEYFDDLIDK
jgi:hypothetical protein